MGLYDSFSLWIHHKLPNLRNTFDFQGKRPKAQSLKTIQLKNNQLQQTVTTEEVQFTAGFL